MPIKLSGPLAIDELATEFGGVVPHSLDEYYAGGIYVVSAAQGTNGPVPTTGPIGLFNFYGAANITGFGYIVNGSTAISFGTIVTTIEKLQFNTESTSVASSTMPESSLYDPCGMYSTTKGYRAGGMDTSNAPKNTINSLLFSNDTTAVVAATLADGTSYQSMSLSSSTKGYLAGGYRAGTSVSNLGNRIDAFVFSNETTTNPAAVLTNSQVQGAGSIVSNLKGYFVGGSGTNSTTYTTIDALLFSAESCSRIAATLSASKSFSASYVDFNQNIGYVAGGSTVSGSNFVSSNSIIGLNYSNETLAVQSASVSSFYYLNISDGVYSIAAGYATGGSSKLGTTPDYLADEIEKFDFSSKTCTKITAKLASSRASYCNFQSR